MKHQASPNHDLDRRDQAFAEHATPAPVHDRHDNDRTEARPEPSRDGNTWQCVVYLLLFGLASR
jgi:hypothetical protein